MAVKEPPWSLTNTHISLAMKHASWFIIEKTFWLLIRFSYDIIDMDVKEPPLSLTYLSFCRQIFFLSPQSEHTGLYHALDPTWIIYVPIQNLWLPLVKTQTIGPYNTSMAWWPWFRPFALMTWMWKNHPYLLPTSLWPWNIHHQGRSQE